MNEADNLRYDPKTGKFWRKAGCKSANGYRQIRFQGRQFMEHRVAWFMHYGEWPKGQIDHINGKRDDNRIVNLRLATPSENLRNRKKPCNNTSGHKGVSWIKRYGHWQATIKFDGKNKNLGNFATREAAAEAYNQAALKYHGEFANLDL
jgi:hypothetical protein